jgi:hypothetical protein
VQLAKAEPAHHASWMHEVNSVNTHPPQMATRLARVLDLTGFGYVALVWRRTECEY